MSLFSVARRRRASLPPINGSSDAYPPDDARSFPVCALRAANRIPSNPVESNRYTISSNRNLVVSSDSASSFLFHHRCVQRPATRSEKDSESDAQVSLCIVHRRVRITSRMFRDSRTKENLERRMTIAKAKSLVGPRVRSTHSASFSKRISLCLATSVSNLDAYTSVSFLARKAYEYFSRPTLTSSRRARLADRHAEATPTRVPNEKQRSFSRKRPPDRSFAFPLFPPVRSSSLTPQFAIRQQLRYSHY